MATGDPKNNHRQSTVLYNNLIKYKVNIESNAFTFIICKVYMLSRKLSVLLTKNVSRLHVTHWFIVNSTLYKLTLISRIDETNTKYVCQGKINVQIIRKFNLQIGTEFGIFRKQQFSKNLAPL